MTSDLEPRAPAAGAEMPLVVRLDGAAGSGDRLAVIGGKGAALDVLIGAGFPVPAAAVVTTAAYRRFVSDPRIEVLLKSFVESSSDAVPVDDDDVDAVFTGIEIPADVCASIIDARRGVASSGPVAVRSSATTEDLGGASFAGQYESVLDVDTDDDLLAATVRVWASLWHRAPRLYRQLHGIPDDDAAMAVLIQAMVPAVSAGVAFTEDPGGATGHIRVEHVDGLAESLVSGKVTPTAHLVPRADPGQRPETTEGVEAVAALAVRSEELFGSPQDVEWADDGAQIWIVQSRPITTGRAPSDDGFDSPLGAHRRYTTAGIAEMLPGVLPALTWSTAGFMVEEAYRRVVDRLGALPPTIVEDNGFVIRVRGRAALDLDHMNDVARVLPGGSPEEVEEQFFGAALPTGGSDTDAPGSAPSVAARIRHDIRVLRSNREGRVEQAITEESIDRVLAVPVDLAALDDRALLAARNRLVDLGARATVAEFAVAAAAVAAFRRLEQVLQKHFGVEDGTRWALRVTSSLRPVSVIQRAEGLARQLVESEPDALGCATWADAESALQTSGRLDLVATIIRAAEHAGCQRVVSGPTWAEDLDAFWRLVSAAGDRPAAGVNERDESELAALEGALVGLPGWQRTRWLTGQVLDVRRQLVRRLVRDASTLLERRESAKADLLGLGGRIRAIDVELGRRLAAKHVVPQALDIEHLHPAEIRAAIDGCPTVTPDVVLARRRRVERWQSEDDLPLTFTGPPTPMAQGAPAGDRLEGWGASPGRHTGPVKYLRSPADAVVDRGDVVVARRTDASWSPVFLKAGAIVVEEGGPLSHAAVVAREFGLPAVVNVPGAATRLRDEHGLVTVDGELGLVVVAAGTDAQEGSG